MYIAKKRLQRAKQQFKQDNVFGFQYHKSEKETPERDAFVSSLIKNTNFVPALKQNDAKFAEPVRETIKKFNAFDYVLVSIFVLSGGMFGYITAQNGTPQNKIVNTQKSIALSVAFITLGALVGLAMGTGTAVAMGASNRESAESSLYARLSVRLFDLMHEMYPELDKNMLKHCNPEMARVIKTLIMANIPEQDVYELQAISMRIYEAVRNMETNDKNYHLIAYAEEMKNAVSIVEHNLVTNPSLHEAILGVYRGNIPAIFTLQNNQKTK